MILTPAKLSKTIQQFKDTVANRVTFELNGVEQETTFSVSVKDNTVRIILQLEAAISGQISNVKVYDPDGLLSCFNSATFVKPAGKKQYIAFSFTFSERVI